MSGMKTETVKMIRVKVPASLAKYLSQGWQRGKTPMSLPEWRGRMLVLEINKMAGQVEALQRSLTKKENVDGSGGE